MKRTVALGGLGLMSGLSFAWGDWVAGVVYVIIVVVLMWTWAVDEKE